MADATGQQKKKKVLSLEAAERRRNRNREYMKRLRQERKAAGIPMYSEQARLNRLAAYRKKYKEDEQFRERVKRLSAESSKRRYAKDKTPWIELAKKRKQRFVSDQEYRNKQRAKNRENAARRYARSEEVRSKHAALFKKWKAANPEYFRKYNRQYKKRRLQEDECFWLQHAIRSRLNIALRRNYAKGSAVDDLGCSIQEFKKHIESQFVQGMSWANRGRGGWHIDHIIPLAAFDLSQESERKKACHYTNMQPLWESENLQKKAKLPDGSTARVRPLLAHSVKRGAKCKITARRSLKSKSTATS